MLTASHYQACKLQILIVPLILSPKFPSTVLFSSCSFRRLRMHILCVPDRFRMRGSAVPCDSSFAVLCDNSSAELCDRAAHSALCTDPTAMRADSSAVAIIADSCFFIAALSCPAFAWDARSDMQKTLLVRGGPARARLRPRGGNGRGVLCGRRGAGGAVEKSRGAGHDL